MEQESAYQDDARQDVLSPCWDGPVHNTSLQDPVQQEPSSSVFGLTLSVCGQGNKSSLYLLCSGCIPRPQCYFLVPPALFEYPVKEGVEGSQLNCTRSAGGPFFPESGICAFAFSD